MSAVARSWQRTTRRGFCCIWSGSRQLEALLWIVCSLPLSAVSACLVTVSGCSISKIWGLLTCVVWWSCRLPYHHTSSCSRRAPLPDAQLSLLHQSPTHVFAAWLVHLFVSCLKCGYSDKSDDALIMEPTGEHKQICVGDSANSKKTACR